mmetsp:Transcript_98735/g.247432  ORF Transcript_98735/g.247432 Transcript_98735/m.247432 type:complete len:91 (-) Transcript_98735:9-281(-)
MLDSSSSNRSRRQLAASPPASAALGTALSLAATPPVCVGGSSQLAHVRSQALLIFQAASCSGNLRYSCARHQVSMVRSKRIGSDPCLLCR